MSRKMITIIGPTASGKTTLAAHLAASYIMDGVNAEILSGDSRQVYRGMDIGTGKDLCDYTVDTSFLDGDSDLLNVDTSVVSDGSACSISENNAVGTANTLCSNEDSGAAKLLNIPYHLIDICDAGEKYNIFQYQQDFLKAYEDVTSRDVLPILCGGSGLYVESVLRGYHLSPVPQNQQLRDSLQGKSLAELTEMLAELKAKSNTVMHNTTDVDSVQRAIRAIEIETYNLENPTPDRYFPPIDTVIIGVDIPRDARRAKISQRLKARVDEGMVDEIKRIIDSGVNPEDLIYYGLEYKYVTEYVIGRLSYDEMLRQLEIAIHQFAKRQMTWFRGMERRGCTIHWVDALLPMKEKVELIRKIVAEEQGDKH